MRRVFPCLLVVVTLGLPARAEQSEAAGAPALSKVQAENARRAEMASLIAVGDAEKRAGRFPEAANAYSKALRLGDNPLVGGRLGVLLVRLGNHVLGADYLLDAIDRADSAPAWERHAFLDAYDVAKSQVCRVTVEVSAAHAQILLDGAIKQEDGVSEFTMFIEPGDHEFRAKLKGFDDAVVNFLAKKATSMRVSLVFAPKAELPELPSSPIKPPFPARIQPSWLPNSNIATDPNYSTKEDPFYAPPKPPKPEEKRGPRFSVNGGIVTVFGVASWNPAVGGVVGVSLMPHENFSIGLEGRAAWLTTPVGNSAISAMTAGGLLGACGHLKWFFGCALGHLGAHVGKSEDGSSNERTFITFMPGIGARIGAQIPISKALKLEAAIEGLGVASGLKVVVGNRVVAEQPPVLIGSHVRAIWEL